MIGSVPGVLGVGGGLLPPWVGVVLEGLDGALAVAAVPPYGAGTAAEADGVVGVRVAGALGLGAGDMLLVGGYDGAALGTGAGAGARAGA